MRYEQLEELLQKLQLDTDTQKVLLGWVAENHVLPGKRMTGRYTGQQKAYFQAIKAALRSNKPVCLGSRQSIGGQSGLGGSANEPVYKGLVAGHAYAVVDIEEQEVGRDGEVCLIQVLNPWGDYGRVFEPNSLNQLKAAEDWSEGSGLFWLTLSDLSKRFDRISIAGRAVT